MHYFGDIGYSINGQILSIFIMDNENNIKSFISLTIGQFSYRCMTDNMPNNNCKLHIKTAGMDKTFSELKKDNLFALSNSITQALCNQNPSLKIT